MKIETSGPTDPAAQLKPKASTFRKPTDSRGNPIVGLWERNGRYYLQITVAGKLSRRPLCNELNDPVRSVPAAVAAAAEFRKKLRQGELPIVGRVPKFSDYRQHCISSLKTLNAKKLKTIQKESSVLHGWEGSIGTLGLNQITPLHVNAYVTQRKAALLNKQRR